MTSRLTSGAATLAATAALVLASSTAASAATWSHNDATADVETTADVPIGNSEPTYTPDPTNTNTDITRVVASNNRTKVVVKFKTRTALPGKNYIAVVDVKTAAARFEATKLNIQGMRTVELTKGHSTVHCKGLAFVVNRTTAITQVTIPRTCLGRASWIQVGAGAVTVTATDGATAGDDGLSPRMHDNLTLSPRIAKG